MGDLDLMEYVSLEELRDISSLADQVRKGGFQHTSNCHLSTRSPVSLSVMTMTSFEILPPTIHLSSWDMIFLMYALTWSSAETRHCARQSNDFPHVDVSMPVSS